MATFELDFYHEDADGNLLDLDSAPTLSDVTGTYGVWSSSTTIVDDGTAMTWVGTGHYQYELTYGDAEATGTILYVTTYSYAVEYTYDGLTDFFQSQFTSSAASSDTYGSAGWVCDRVEEYLGGTIDAGVALRYVQGGYQDFLRGMDPRTGMRRLWSFLKTYDELTLPASAEGTASGPYTASVSGRQVGTIAVTATSEIFTSAHEGGYLTVENVGTYRITTYTSTTQVTVQVLSGQTAADFTSETVRVAGIVDLPSDFAGIIGRPTYVYSSDYHTPYLQEASPQQIFDMWRMYEDENEPTHFAIIPKEFANSAEQRYQLIFAPRSVNTQVIRMQRYVRPDVLTDSTAVWFLGGREHAETILQAGLANAELRRFKAKGEQTAEYERLMVGSIETDVNMDTYGPLTIPDAG